MIVLSPLIDMQFTSLTSTSPSSNNLADIAARVVAELRNQNSHDNYDDDDDIYNFDDEEPEESFVKENKDESDESDEDEEFEFPVSADDIFFNGEIRYPLFDRSLLFDDDVTDKSNTNSKNSNSVRTSPVVRQPLRKLFIEERELSSSSSSSEGDDLDGVSPETYCIWKPKECKKSNSTGNSSKRWTFRNLLHRSNSDINRTAGKNAPVIVFRPVTATKKRSEKVKKVDKTAKVEPAPVTDEIKSANKLNKPDLVGLFANVNGLNRNLQPF